MEIEERLVAEHSALRARLAEMAALLAAPSVYRDRLTPEAARRLGLVEKEFSEALRAHEKFETEHLTRALLQAGAPGEAAAQALSAQHEDIQGIFHVLAALTRVSETESAYAIEFTLNNVSRKIESHLKFEEEELFQLLRSLKETAGAQPAG